MSDLVKKLWNPVAFFISLMMSILMPFLFTVLPQFFGYEGIPIDILFI